MGIKGAHFILGPTAQSHSWAELTAIKGLLDPNGFLVGVDASPMMESSQRSPHQRHQQSGMNGPLKDLFRFLGRLSQYPVTAVFVFDGPERPKVKRNKKVVFEPHSLTEPFQEVIKVFGFYIHQAPGEADAELAAMNRLHAVDMVLSPDSDLTVFGALAVGRNLNLMTARPFISIYSQDKIREKLGITWGGLVLFALATGGDYDEGIPGCGPQIAAALARTSFGDELVSAFSTLSQTDFMVFRADWQKRFKKEIATNCSGKLPRRCGKLAKRVPSYFPSYTILRLYISPPASKSFDRSLWMFAGAPNIRSLVDLYQKRFWPAHDLTKVFQKHIIPGMILRQLMHMQHDTVTALRVGSRLPKDPHASATFVAYSVRVDLSSLATTKGLEGLAKSINIKIPAILLSIAAPALLSSPLPLQKLLNGFESALPMSRSLDDSYGGIAGGSIEGEDSDACSDSEVGPGGDIINISDTEDFSTEGDDEGPGVIVIDSDEEGDKEDDTQVDYIDVD